MQNSVLISPDVPLGSERNFSARSFVEKVHQGTFVRKTWSCQADGKFKWLDSIPRFVGPKPRPFLWLTASSCVLFQEISSFIASLAWPCFLFHGLVRVKHLRGLSYLFLGSVKNEFLASFFFEICLAGHYLMFLRICSSHFLNFLINIYWFTCVGKSWVRFAHQWNAIQTSLHHSISLIFSQFKLLLFYHGCSEKSPVNKVVVSSKWVWLTMILLNMKFYFRRFDAPRAMTFPSKSNSFGICRFLEMLT